MRFLKAVLLFFPFISAAQTDTVKIYFDIAKWEAQAIELSKLDGDKANWQKVDIISYTDYLGTKEYNEQLSLKRSQEIRSRLIQRNLKSEQLGVVEGRGIVGITLDSKEGIQENRRTDVIIYRVEREVIEVSKVEEPISAEPEEDLKETIKESEVGDNLVIKGLDFIPGYHLFTEQGDSAFSELFKILNENPNLKINIEGHICCNLSGEDGLDMGTSIYNLSTARAKYVNDRLIELGIAENRLSYEGFAREKPLFPDENSELEKQANRRVEIRILEK